jgi:hypothetical protein
VKEMVPSEYVKWVTDTENGLRVSKNIGDCSYVLQYKPSEYEVLLHNQDVALNKRTMDSLKETVKGLQYFMLTISNKDGKEVAGENSIDQAEYNAKLDYMIADMQMDFSLIDGHDTLPCAFYHYERNFKLSPVNNILLGFEKGASANNLNNKTLIYNDRLLGNGMVLLTIKAENIQKIPLLKFTN